MHPGGGGGGRRERRRNREKKKKKKKNRKRRRITITQPCTQQYFKIHSLTTISLQGHFSTPEHMTFPYIYNLPPLASPGHLYQHLQGRSNVTLHIHCDLYTQTLTLYLTSPTSLPSSLLTYYQSQTQARLPCTPSAQCYQVYVGCLSL